MTVKHSLTDESRDCLSFTIAQGTGARRHAATPGNRRNRLSAQGSDRCPIHSNQSTCCPGAPSAATGWRDCPPNTGARSVAETWTGPAPSAAETRYPPAHLRAPPAANTIERHRRPHFRTIETTSRQLRAQRRGGPKPWKAILICDYEKAPAWGIMLARCLGAVPGRPDSVRPVEIVYTNVECPPCA